MPIIVRGGGGTPGIATGQTTVYAPGDDASFQKGNAKSYTVNDSGAYAGSTTIDVPAYAAATISFDDNGAGVYSINDSANLLAQFKTGDTIFIHNAANAANCGVFTVKTGNVAGTIVVNETTIVDEAAGAIITICKRSTILNQTAYDNNVVVSGVKREWMATTSNGMKIGPTSVGTLLWYAFASVYTVYSTGNTISCTAPNIMKIIGGAALTQFKVGYCYQFGGFATAMNNKTGGWECTAVTVNGDDLDLTFKTYDYASFTTEGAVGDTIGIVCNSLMAFCAACNAGAVSGLTDWESANLEEQATLLKWGETLTRVPDSTAFPSYTTLGVWGSTTSLETTTSAFYMAPSTGAMTKAGKNLAAIAHLKRGP